MKNIEVVAGIIFKGDTILTTQRGYGEFKGMWEFPGGKVQSGENLKDALKRELKEELDIEVQVEEYLTTVDYDYPAFHITLHCFKCKLEEGTTIHLLEHLSAKWLSSDELFCVNWLPADLPIVKLLSTPSSINNEGI